MVKYYRLDKKEVQDCNTDIPQEQWVKKQVLPYELVWVEVPDTEVLPVDTIDILENKVLETKHKHIHIPTLDEYKANKIQMLKSNTLQYTYSIIPQYKRDQIFSQANGFDWGITTLDITKVNDWLLQHKTEVDLIETRILTATTKEEIDLEPDVVEIKWV